MTSNWSPRRIAELSGSVGESRPMVVVPWPVHKGQRPAWSTLYALKPQPSSRDLRPIHIWGCLLRQTLGSNSDPLLVCIITISSRDGELWQLQEGKRCTHRNEILSHVHSDFPGSKIAKLYCPLLFGRLMHFVNRLSRGYHISLCSFVEKARNKVWKTTTPYSFSQNEKRVPYNLSRKEIPY